MDSRSDLELVREFVRSGAQSAFAELVHRHVDLVYTAARRQVRDPHLAQDVSQTVFLALLRKAASMKANVVLEGWLLNATRYAAQDALRSDRRRRGHEAVAARNRSQEMQHDPPASNAAERKELADRLDSLLDGALSHLSAASRDAVVLRFFQNKSFNDVGRELGIGEQAAKQRVFRGLRQLRKILIASGLDLPMETLGTVLGAQGILPAPPGLAHSIIAASAKTAVAATATASVTKGALTIMAWTKAKIAAAAAVGLLLVSGSAVVVHHYATGGSRVMVIKPGTPLPPGVANQVPAQVAFWDIRTIKAQPYSGPAITGVVLDAAGNPVADAQVLVSSENAAVSVYPSPRPTNVKVPTTRTSADGHFALTPTEKPLALVVRCPSGYGAALVSDPTKPVSINIQPWARLEGIVRSGSKPVAHARLDIVQTSDQAAWNLWHVVKEQQIETDENGRFVMEHVVPGKTSIARNWARGRVYHADLPAGRTTIVNVGGDRTVVGHLPAAARSFSFRNGSLQVPRPKMPQPPNWDQLDDTQKQKLQRAFWSTPELKQWSETANMGQFEVDRNGTFQVEDVPPGTYTIQVQVGDSTRGSHYIESAGWGEKTITVPPLSADLLDVPLDIGEVDVTLLKRMAVGDSTPEIAGDFPDGSSARLSDFHGKYVVLYFWASDRPDLLAKLPMLKALSDRFGGGRQVSIVGVSVDDSKDAAIKAIADQQIQWPQILLHGWDDHRLPREYTYSPAMLFLIDPEGRLVAKNLDVAGVFGILQRTLPAPTMSTVHVEHQLPGHEQSWSVSNGAENLAGHATFTLIDGESRTTAGALELLHDGLLPNNADAPTENFSFANGTLEGRLRVDLGSVMPVAQVKTYSWHKSDRGPQVYNLYAASGDAPNFNPSPKIGTDPATCGWTPIAMINTRTGGPAVGGRYIVQIGDPSTSLGSFRYLLFEDFVTETSDLWGHTFYSEIEVIRSQ